MKTAIETAEQGPITGASFKRMRVELGISAKDFGNVFGYAPETISRWERGHRDVDRCAWLLLSGLILDPERTKTLSRICRLTGKPFRAGVV